MTRVRIKIYKTAAAVDPQKLTDLVNNEIKGEWEPVGGVAIAPNGVLIQALVKYDDATGIIREATQIPKPKPNLPPRR